MNKQVDMSAFIGKEFDCEFSKPFLKTSPYPMYLPLIQDLYNIDGHKGSECFYPDLFENTAFKICSPRTHRVQVLDDWSWVPDGLVWDVITIYDSGPKFYEKVNSASLSSIPDYCSLVMAKCIGVEPEYSLWGEERGMKVIKL